MKAIAKMETIALPLMLRLLQKVEFPHKLGVMDRLFGNEMSRRGVCWVNTAAGLRWKLDLENCTHRWIVYGKYEGPGFHKWAQRSLRRDGVIVDSGANIGQMLLYLGQLVPEGRILAIEPGQAQAQWLAECLVQYPALPVELICLGLGPEARTVLLTDDGNPTTHGGQSFVSDTKGVPIQIVRLEDELRKRAIARVDLWKLDVEGYEIPALEGARTLLKNRAIDAIYVELHEKNGERIKDYLSGYGYQCHSISDQGRVSLMKVLPEHTNGLFLPAPS
jgi:FkbM family methyltransferase